MDIRVTSTASAPPIGISTPVANRLEWPTIVLALVIHGGWLAATFAHDQLHPVLLGLIGGWLIAWHGSLQHEVIHGHPTPWRRMNTLIAAAPLSLWLPFEAYRRSHLQHHASEHVTHPEFDPEARYLPAHGGRLHGLAIAVARLQATLAGRMAFGPLSEVAAFGASEVRRLRRNEAGVRAYWLRHLLGVSLVFAWLHFACEMPIEKYVFFFVYPGVALSLIRSFAEHRADPDPARRVAIVERAPLLGLLFLNNNLHAAHHAWPGLAWWRLPHRYRQHREALLSANGGLVYNGYGEVARRFLLRAHDKVTHPSSGSRRHQ